MSAQLVQARVQPTRRCAWYGGSLLVTNERLECDESDMLTGYYFREARHLRTLRLRLNGSVTPGSLEGSMQRIVFGHSFSNRSTWRSGTSYRRRSTRQPTLIRVRRITREASPCPTRPPTSIASPRRQTRRSSTCGSSTFQGPGS